MPTIRRSLRRLAFATVLLAAPEHARGQDANIPLSVAEIERVLGTADFEVLRVSPSRGFNTERTYQLTVTLEDGSVMQFKFAPAPEGGTAFNNRPDYELAPYALQKLFLDEPDYVVPPTVARAFALDVAEEIVGMAPGTPNPVQQTFPDWRVTLSVVQYWLQAVRPATNDEIEDRERFASDPAFARHTANFNLLTYLIRHADSNEGNFMISGDPSNPRIFSVDNGVAFSSEASDRGQHWSELRFDAFPARSIARLRQLDLATLERELGVLAQLEVELGAFVPAERTENLDPTTSIRRSGSVIQVGLSANDIRGVYSRLTRLLEQVDSGRYSTFP